MSDCHSVRDILIGFGFFGVSLSLIRSAACCDSSILGMIGLLLLGISTGLCIGWVFHVRNVWIVGVITVVLFYVLFASIVYVTYH